MRMAVGMALAAMDANLIMGLLCLGGLAVFLLRLLWLFVLSDEQGFRFSAKHGQRVKGDQRLLDELVKKLTPYVLAIRSQPERHIGGAAYTFREGARGQPLQIDKVLIFSAQTREPVAVDTLPAAGVPLARKLESPAARHIVETFAGQRKGFKATDRIMLRSDCVSLIEQRWIRFAPLYLNIYIGQKGETLGANVANG